MPVTPQNVYNALLVTPGGTLKTYPIRIHGSPGASGVVGFCIKYRGASQRPGTVRGTGKMHDTDAYDIRTMVTVNNFGGLDGGHTFNAHSIHMDADIQTMAPYLLGNAGPAIVVTGQLSGCSFVASANPAGGVNVAHVRCQPGQGAALATQLAQAVANSQVYGATDTIAGDYDANDRAASVIGVRSGGQWRIYAQKQDPTTAYSIKSVYQIWPRRQRQ
jgi:hypothetical protein